MSEPHLKDHISTFSLPSDMAKTEISCTLLSDNTSSSYKQQAYRQVKASSHFLCEQNPDKDNFAGSFTEIRQNNLTRIEGNFFNALLFLLLARKKTRLVHNHYKRKLCDIPPSMSYFTFKTTDTL